MPQDADGAGLISLVWMACFYWNIRWWLQQLALLERTRNQQQAGDPGASLPGEAEALAVPAALPQDCAALVSKILLHDGSASLDDFLAERLSAYEAVVAAFDAGDRDKLGRLVSGDVHEAFCGALASREGERRRIETVFSRIERPEILAAQIEDAYMEVSIRFKSEFFKLYRDAAGQPEAGTSAARLSSEIWTFGREAASRDGAWRVLATEAGI